uniref:Uncharacterized protein n=1 Tax=Arundo donax TaxID=35708 RepID=A0A0A9DAK6_ARUDO
MTNEQSTSVNRTKKSVSFAPQDVNKDVIPLEDENEIVPDSISPSPQNRSLRFIGFQKATYYK